MNDYPHTAAIRVDAVTGDVSKIDLGPAVLRGLYAAIECSLVDRIGLTPRIDAWVDDEGAIVAEPKVNLVASLVIRSMVPDYPPVCGHAVFVARSGPNTVGLNDIELALVYRLAQAARSRVEAMIR